MLLGPLISSSSLILPLSKGALSDVDGGEAVGDDAFDEPIPVPNLLSWTSFTSI